MTDQPPSTPTSRFPAIAVLIVVVLLAVLLLQVYRTGVVDKYLVGALVVLALAFSGYGGDRLLEKYLDGRGKGP